MDGTGSERFENRGPAPGSSGDHNPVVGGALAESKLLHTEHVHRREGALRVKLPLVDLGEVKEQLGLGCTRFAHELAGAGQEIVVVHYGDCRICIDHAVNGSMPISAFWDLRYDARGQTRRDPRRTRPGEATCGHLIPHKNRC